MTIEEINRNYQWSDWKTFPNPEKKGYIFAPFGAGVYQVRNNITQEYILFGESKNLAYRMTSLLPRPLGAGTRKASDKREYIIENLQDIEYRTTACDSKDEAKEIQKELRNLRIHKFNR